MPITIASLNDASRNSYYIYRICRLLWTIWVCDSSYALADRTVYSVVPEDWLWFAILPCGNYAALALGALLLPAATHLALFVIGGETLALLFIGIHNAWGSVTYIVADPHGEATEQE